MKVLRGLIKQVKFDWAAELRNVPKVVAVEQLESIFFEGGKNWPGIFSRQKACTF